MVLLSLLPLVFLLALVLTGGLRHYSLKRGVIDIPNSRSSHTVPTPRGGGLAIVMSYLLAVLLLGFSDLVEWNLVIAIFGSGAGVALLGFLDDHGHIAARWRLLGHFLAAIWVLFWMKGLPPLAIWGHHLELGWVGNVVAAFYLVWLLNLYNFMDGIDGIASVEAICVCFGGVWLLGISTAGWFSQGIWLSGALICAVTGFLCWNFPPARIFMGDAGSGFLGIVLGALSLQAAWAEPRLLWGWLILLGVFIVDATFTLMRRLLRGDKVYEAHRSHAYQYAARQAGRHLPVTCAVVFINLIWLFPLSLLVAVGYLDGVIAILIAYAPLLALAVKFHAGEPEKKP
ncbi:TPA: glycosyltransferase family 4 protein [Pseudomonas aeruginosa]|nr:glycosyltransferase family 4 protein [Pseudomonas aeruginosa]HEJ5396815.1 glycosyltransferase family 4 protein [Pseudomonas aeruginosa]